MKSLNLEDVFTRRGVPTHTYVKPSEYSRILVALRSKGIGLVVEGPSGVGKTSSIIKVLEELSLADSVTYLSARKIEDREYIAALPSMDDIGTVIIDDFHKLDNKLKAKISDLMKLFAEEGNTANKIVIIGINRVGNSLVKFARDLNDRIETVKFGSNTNEQISELIRLGESALNIRIDHRDLLIAQSYGSFHLAQILSYELCV